MLNSKKYLKERIIKSLEENHHIDYYLLSIINNQLEKSDNEFYYGKKIVTNSKKIIKGGIFTKDDKRYFSIVIDHDNDFISYCQFVNGIAAHYICQDGFNTQKRAITEREYVGPMLTDDGIAKKRDTIKTNVRKYDKNGCLVYDSNSVHYDYFNLDTHTDSVTTIENWYYELEAASRSSEETNKYREVILTKTTELLSSQTNVWYKISKKVVNDDGDQIYIYKPVGELEFNRFQEAHNKSEEALSKGKIKELALN